MVKTLAALAICLMTSTAFGQQPTGRKPVVPGPAELPQQAEIMKLQMMMMEAQQKAVRPGDEALSCEALQKELVSTMNDPAIQSYAEKTNRLHANDLAARHKELTPEAAAALAAALAPEPGMPGMPPIAPRQPTTREEMQRAIAAQQHASLDYMNQLAPLMPALMRSQRVGMLATVKNCTWATGLDVYRGASPATVVPPRAIAPRRN